MPTVLKPNDPLWTLQWHFQNNGSDPGTTPGGAGFLDFWTRQGTQGSADVVVAVVDTGLDLSHPDIEDSLNLAPGWDMVSDPSMGNDGDGRDPDPNDPGDLCDPNDPFAEDSYHGTHVAGTIGANLSNNRSGVAGGAWNVTVVPVRALGRCGGRLTDINDAIRWAGGLVPSFDTQGNEIWNENPADIINLSIGLFEFCPASLQEAINAVTERGVVVVSAAGNARPDNQRLEFLGDRVLGLVIAEALMASRPDEAEGTLAPRLNALVRRETLAEVALEIGLGAHLVLGRSENVSGGRRKNAILADATEAVIAAIYLDGGLEAARGFIMRHWEGRIAASNAA
ncbi:MAG: S8 family serine peptidase, partial [Pseudomonadota bacterium]